MRTTTKEQWLRGALVAVVLFHTIVHLWHSTTHVQIPVPLTAAQIALVVVVVLVLPLLGAGLLWTTRKREAAWLITVSMLVSLVFGFISHFVLSGSSDYVLAVPAGVRCQPQRPTVATKGGLNQRKRARDECDTPLNTDRGQKDAVSAVVSLPNRL